MKLIPPQPATTPEPSAPPPLPKSDKTPAQHKIVALSLLNQVGQAFSDALAAAVRRISKGEGVTPALALAAFLTGGTDMVNNLANTDAPNVQEGNDGHKGRNRTTGRRAGNVGANKSRAAGRGTDNRANAGGDSDGTQPPKRGRGRPKGSKNRATLEREAAEREAARIARASAVTGEKAVVRRKAAKKRVVKKPVVRRPAGTIIKRGEATRNSGHRRPASRRKGAAKKVARKR